MSISCEICGKLYGSKAGLRSHKLNYHSKKEFICDICGKLSKSKALLARHHKTVHVGNRDFKCDHCKFSGKTKSRLLEHFQSMHVEKKCSQCEFKTTVFQKLRNHQIAHRDEPYSSCDKCDFLYTQEINFLKHKTKMHPPENKSRISLIKCNMCSFTARLRMSLKKHAQLKHS